MLSSFRSVLAFLAGTLAVPGAPLHFEPRVIADDLKGGYQVVACDVNGDGKLDLIALASSMPDLVWFESPDWQRHTLAKGLPRMINLACWAERTGAAPHIVVAYEFSMNAAESPGVVAELQPPDDVRQPWSIHEIDRLPTSHRLRWADIDGTGKKVLINTPLSGPDAHAPDFRGHVPLSYYRPGDWKRRSMNSSEQGIVHGIFVTDWDNDGRDEILIGGFLGIHLYKFGANGNWSATAIARGNPDPWPKSGTSDIAVGRLGKERFLATIEPWHGNQVVVYRQGKNIWNREVVDDSLLDAHTISASDFDADGNDEIIAGFRGKPYGVYLYHYAQRKWNRQALDTGSVSAASCAVADLDADKRPDIACIGSATHNLKLYRNVSGK